MPSNARPADSRGSRGLGPGCGTWRRGTDDGDRGRRAAPDATFKVRTPDGLKDMTTKELFGGKRVVLFAVPGAFTPTCHAKHLPSYLEHHEALRGKGIDTVACVSVNDAFVLDAWGRPAGSGTSS